MSERPTVLVLMGAFWPKHDATGPNLSLKAMGEALRDAFDFRLIARDRPFGSDAPIVAAGRWHDLGWAKVHYLPVGRRGAAGLATLIRETPHDMLFLNGFFDREFTMPALFARRFGRIPKRPLLLAPRGEFSQGSLGLKGARKSLYRLVERALGLTKDVTLLATSAEEEADLRAAFPRHTIVRIDNFRPLFALPEYQPGDALRVAFLGRISPVKGLDAALEALALVERRVDFTIYGPANDPVYWERCQALIAKLPANIHARHGGTLSNAEVPAAMAAQDAMLLPSRSENFGHAIFEALAAGTPVVIGDKTPWRALPDARAGFDVALPDPAALASAVTQLASMPPTEYAAWRAGARARAEAFVATSTARADMARLFHHMAGQ